MKPLPLLLFLAALAAAAWAWFFGPYYLDAVKMEDVAGSAVLSWAAFDEGRGRSELAEELRRREIPDYLTPDACKFYKQGGGEKVVDCSWTVDVYLPVIDHTRRLAFQVVQVAGADGRLAE